MHLSYAGKPGRHSRHNNYFFGIFRLIGCIPACFTLFISKKTKAEPARKRGDEKSI